MSRSERGGVFIAVLGVTLFVTLVGLSAMMLVGSEREALRAVSEARLASTDAHSAIEIALTRVAGDASWRTTRRSGVWSDAEMLGDTKWSSMLEYDEGTPADEEVEATLTVGARHNESARFYSVDVVVPPNGTSLSPNLCPNPDFEGTYSPWYPLACTLSLDSSKQHGGAQSLSVSGRFIPSTGPLLELKSIVTDGTSYQVSMWVRVADGATETIRVSMTSMVEFTATEDRFDVAGVDKNWTHVSGVLTPDWENGRSPDNVTLRIETVGTKTDLWIDDVEIREITPVTGLAPIEIVSGSFRQRVLE